VGLPGLVVSDGAEGFCFEIQTDAFCADLDVGPDISQERGLCGGVWENRPNFN